MKRISYLVIGILAVALIFPQVIASTGFGPAEIITSNRREERIGSACIINNNPEAQYGVFVLTPPPIVPKEHRYLRVICRDCGEGLTRYEVIEDYSYPDSPLQGTCPECGSHDLIFYKRIPPEELDYIYLKGVEIELEQVDTKTYVTIDKIPAREVTTIDVMYNANKSYIVENKGEYWEAYLQGTLSAKKTGGGFGVVGGIILRLLIEFKFPLYIDAPELVDRNTTFDVKVTYGDNEESWGSIPEKTFVKFNDEVKEIDENGVASFVSPIRGKGNEYAIEAYGDKYLSQTKTVVVDIIIIEESSTMMFPILVAGAIVILIVVVNYYVFIYRRRKKDAKID